MKRSVGVAVAVKEPELLAMTWTQRDEFGVETVNHLEHLLREYVGGAPPIPGTEFRVGIIPAVDDPLQGRIVMVSLTGEFETEQMPVGCGAYLQYVVNEPT